MELYQSISLPFIKKGYIVCVRMYAHARAPAHAHKGVLTGLEKTRYIPAGDPCVYARFTEARFKFDLGFLKKNIARNPTGGRFSAKPRCFFLPGFLSGKNSGNPGPCGWPGKGIYRVLFFSTSKKGIYPAQDQGSCRVSGGICLFSIFLQHVKKWVLSLMILWTYSPDGSAWYFAVFRRKKPVERLGL